MLECKLCKNWKSSCESIKISEMFKCGKDSSDSGTLWCEFCKEMKHVFCEADSYDFHDILIIKHPMKNTIQSVE